MKQLASFSNWPIQNDELEALYRLIETYRAPHALLLTGLHQNTRKLAEYLGKLFLCSGEDAPCGKCESCRQFEAGSHPDFLLIDGAESGSIKTGQIEELQSQMKVRAHHGGERIYVLTGIDTATPVAANRLLKTLEEPASPVRAILTSANPGRILPTVKSRLFSYLTEPLGQPAGPESDNLHEPETVHKGSAESDAETKFVSFQEPVIKWTHRWLRQQEPALVLAASLMDIASSNDLPDVLDTVLQWLRDVMHFRVGANRLFVFSAYEKELETQAKLASAQQFARAVELVTDAKTRLQAHVAANLNIEQLCIRLRGVL
ncbi:hypothetical protein [Alicyclobacillus sp. SO9]|uniref:DNA polymerase III subunit n=1 Tax=Alicyclobacillus sp. SO9 TaxID=2665646 RepID=UPI0018E7D8D3|nr:hypothetical protein [Alicyclobacillus sp. SO9]QQE79384.1 hypothetical protein GI364_02455 [Alicyclobacillus sp. SO9]